MNRPAGLFSQQVTLFLFILVTFLGTFLTTGCQPPNASPDAGSPPAQPPPAEAADAAVTTAAVVKTTAQSQRECITDPEDYISAFKSCAPVTCVSPDLYGVIGSPDPLDPEPRIYPKEYAWGWVAGYENLEKYAAWQNAECNSATVTKNILTYVGFGPSDIKAGDKYSLSVMDLGSEPSLLVPTFEAWALAFWQKYDLKIPISAQKGMTLATAPEADPIDPVAKYVELTGCDKSASMQCARSTHCQLAYKRVALALKKVSPAEGTGNADTCVAAFKRAVVDLNAMQPAEARALLVYCVDANPCNTGLGLSYNPAYPADGQTSPADSQTLDHYTGREFVLDNKTLKEVHAATVPLPELD